MPVRHIGMARKSSRIACVAIAVAITAPRQVPSSSSKTTGATRDMLSPDTARALLALAVRFAGRCVGFALAEIANAILDLRRMVAFQDGHFDTFFFARVRAPRMCVIRVSSRSIFACSSSRSSPRQDGHVVQFLRRYSDCPQRAAFGTAFDRELEIDRLLNRRFKARRVAHFHAAMLRSSSAVVVMMRAWIALASAS